MQDREKDLSMGRATAAIHRGGLAASIYGEVSVPIFQTSTFGFPSAEAGAARFTGAEPGFIYTRMGNPTVAALEEAIAAHGPTPRQGQAFSGGEPRADAGE